MLMCIWLLRSVIDHSGLDTAFAHVVCAFTEAAARELASLKAGDEGAGHWRNKTLSTCTRLGIADDLSERVVMTDIRGF